MTKLKPETVIWRYMDVARFLGLIYEKKIYFARLHELGDPWEGARSDSDPMFFRDPEYVRPAVQDFNLRPLISCWHENEGESVAMWKLYVSGREGVAVKTTVARLGRFASADRELKIGRVEYRDIDDLEHRAKALLFEYGIYTRDDTVSPVERALFRKNKGFGHEQEVRAVRYDPHYDANGAIWATTLDGMSPHLEADRGETDRGQNVEGDLSLLIERIVVSPEFPQWAFGSLQKAVDAAGVRVRVESSSLLDPPAPHVAAALNADPLLRSG
jgi:hypothetical protein